MALHAATIALSAFLLFLVQPIIAKQIVPWFGGSAAVWTTCLVFFQVALLAGYLYSDLLARRLSARSQAVVHAALLVASLAFLPITAPTSLAPTNPDAPIARILLLLLRTIGLPYLMLATTGPLLQAWFTRRWAGARVWRLYALSNAASMLALLAYPVLVEPNSGERAQSIGWSFGYALFAVLALLAAWRTAPLRGHLPALAGADARRASATNAPAVATAADAMAAGPSGGAAPTAATQAAWLVLAALGTTLLLSVTTHVTQNVASIPFLWIAPLAIYLLTFILCFDGRAFPRVPTTFVACVVATLMLAGLVFHFTAGWRIEQGLLPLRQAMTLYLAGLFVLCMFCHGELVARRPATDWLTRFYLMVSLGGALGGLFVGLVAPLAFDWYWELPVALLAVAVAALLSLRGWMRALAALVVLGACALVVNYAHTVRSDTVELARNFYGALRVRATAPDADPNARWRLLHGVITHGEQYRAPALRRRATTYYGETSGVGRAIAAIRQGRPGQPLRFGLVGLGVGTLSAYGEPGDRMRIYELNPRVLELAQRDFTYLRDSAAQIIVPLGDARLTLEREPPQGLDLLAIDAFSSDSIPVHLLTREAARVYRRQLADDGVLAIHISNRYLDLTQVARGVADEIGFEALRVVDEPPEGSYLYRSDWVIATRDPRVLAELRAGDVGERIEPDPRFRAWTDAYNNLFQVLK